MTTTSKLIFIVGEDEQTDQNFGESNSTEVRLYEDAVGGLYLWQVGRKYAIGLGNQPATAAGCHHRLWHRYGCFDIDAHSLSMGQVADGSWYGQTAYPARQLKTDARAGTSKCIGIYSPRTASGIILHNLSGKPVANSGRAYLGLKN